MITKVKVGDYDALLIWDQTTKSEVINALYGDEARKVDIAIPQAAWKDYDLKWTVWDYNGEVFGEPVDLRAKALKDSIYLLRVSHIMPIGMD